MKVKRSLSRKVWTEAIEAIKLAGLLSLVVSVSTD